MKQAHSYGTFALLNPFKDFHFNFPHSQNSENGGSWLIKYYTDENYCKVFYNHVHNILRFSYGWANFPVTTIETKRETGIYEVKCINDV